MIGLITILLLLFQHGPEIELLLIGCPAYQAFDFFHRALLDIAHCVVSIDTLDNPPIRHRRTGIAP
jgi:hypothetical protein